MEIKKTCIKCKRSKPLNCFSKNKSFLDGHKSVCKDCINERNRKRKMNERLFIIQPDAIYC